MEEDRAGWDGAGMEQDGAGLNRTGQEWSWIEQDEMGQEAFGHCASALPPDGSL